MVKPLHRKHIITPTRCNPMMIQPSGDWSVFKRIFADHWDEFQRAHPRYQTSGLDHGVGHPSCLVILTLVVGLSGCTGMSQTEQSALSGGAMGAAGGALIGAMAGNAGMGAAIGGEVGLTGGYLYGKHKESEQKAYQQGYQQSQQSR
jgi:osmotically inducible lipoprotein OsmB